MPLIVTILHENGIKMSSPIIFNNNALLPYQLRAGLA